MPYVKFDNPKSFASNKGSCSDFIHYLSKEDFRKEALSKEFCFNQSSKQIPDFEVIESIDTNKKGLGKNDAKFYTGSINFSQEELFFIENDIEKIKEYSIKVMEIYAKQFNKSIEIDNLNWYAKIERNRYYKGDDEEVKNGTVKQGDIKSGQTHVHFIVGHKTKDDIKKISPKTNHRSTQKGPVIGGFNRDSFKENCEQKFDELFGYLRPLEETYYSNKMRSNGTIEAKELIISSIGDERSNKNSYLQLTSTEKERKIEKLAYFICYGSAKAYVKKIETKRLIDFEKNLNYTGTIYKSLVNLNQSMKRGNIPKEFDLTSLILNNAKSIGAKEAFDSRQSSSNRIFLQSTINENDHNSWTMDNSDNRLVDFGNNTPNDRDEAEDIIKRLRRKRKRNI